MGSQLKLLGLNMKFYLLALGFLALAQAAAPGPRRLHVRPLDFAHINASRTPSDVLEHLLDENKTELIDPDMLIPFKRSLDLDIAVEDRATTDCACGLAPAASRIVNGAEVSPMHSRPYQVYLQSCSSTGCAMCGATLLNKRYALTAMHCVQGATNLVVSVGEHNIRDNVETIQPQTIEVSSVIKRGDYSESDVNNDIAILRLETEVVFNNNVVPACLPTDTRDYTGYSAYVSGWGTTSEGGSTSNVLREVEQIILSNTDPICVTGSQDSPVPNSKMCAYKQGTDSCQGDSGGPLVVQEDGRWTVVGVVSYGIGCARTGYSGVYARVTNYMNWIQSNIADGWCEGESSAIKFPTATTSSSQNQQWCDFRCTNVGTLSMQSVNLNGIPSTCSNGFCRATDGSSLCATFSFPCGTSQPSGDLVLTITSTTTTTTTTTTKTAGLSCHQPCDLSLALGSLMHNYRTGLYNVLVGPTWNRIPAVADMATGLACPTDFPDSDLCQRLGLFGLFGR